MSYAWDFCGEGCTENWLFEMQGLTPAGYLRAVDDDSETYELHPDGNRYERTLVGYQVSILIMIIKYENDGKFTNFRL